jgi:protein-disulfide isomerase
MGLFGIIVGYGIATAQLGGVVIGGTRTAGQVAADNNTNPPTPTPAQPTEPQAPAQPMPPIDPATDHIYGNLSKAKVAIVEYSDFECPFCKRLYEDAQKQVRETYGDDVVWVFRHFPLSFHANAQKEAEASECAGELGGNDAFWEYHDKLFERTTSNGTGFALDQLVPLAKELGLNEAKFKACLDSGKYAQRVQDQESTGASAGVSGTPGNFVVDLATQKTDTIPGAQPFSAFKTKIDAILGAS